ncbi:hypothetical protein [Enterobacter asburiae]|uniref:hypothetical protein n=1 Tax=Enterobacter asburiae TaxID=61645 RepID=UPI00307637F6
MIIIKMVQKKRWWVNPLLYVLKALAFLRIVKEKHINPPTNFIARWGFSFKTEK